MRIVCVCPEFPGHLNPTLSVAKELQGRGHQVAFIARRDGVSRIERAGFDVHEIGIEQYPLGALAAFQERLGESSGRKALELTKGDLVNQLHVAFRDMPAIVKDVAPDGMLIDQLSAAANSVAERFGIPFVTLANALPMNEDPSVPPPVFGWKHGTGPLMRFRNKLGWGLFREFVKSYKNTLNEYRLEWNLPAYQSMEETRSQLADIWQSPVGFEFPGRQLNPWCHQVGPLISPAAREPIDFPYERLDERPLVYASMGTLQNRQSHVFHKIIDACEGLGCQLVVSLGNDASEMKQKLPSWPIVVNVAPQLELLKRAVLTITHAGLNTALESLVNGVPMVAIPITNDQPAVASRIRFAGIGKVVSLQGLNVAKLRSAVSKVLEQDEFRDNATKLGKRIAEAGGACRAAEIVEHTLASKGPVFR